MSNTFEYTDIARVDSTAIDIIAYNQNNGQLFIQFDHGSVAVYEDVEHEVFTEFTEAGSKGRFFNFEIYGEYTNITKSGDYSLVYVTVPVPADDGLAFTEIDNVDLYGPDATDTPLEQLHNEFVGNAVSVSVNFAPRRYGVRFVIPGKSVGGETEVQAGTDDEAIVNFNGLIEQAQPFVAPGYFDGLKITAVVRYLD